MSAAHELSNLCGKRMSLWKRPLLSLVVLWGVWLTVTAVSAQSWLDAFDDRDHTDGNPVRWLTNPLGLFPGNYDSSSGDFTFLTDPFASDETMVAWVDNLEYANRGSVRTQTQLLPEIEGEFTGQGNVGPTLFFDPTTVSGYVGAIDAGGVLYLVASIGGELTTLGEMQSEINAHEPTILQVDHDGVNVSLTAWAAGDSQPTTPQISVPDRTFTRGTVGLVLLEDAANDVSIFNWVHGSSIPIVDGDVNVDGRVDEDDIDLLFAVQGSSDLVYDLNMDSLVSRSDIDFLVREILGTNYGDANLDGDVDRNDLDIWNGQKFSVAPGWSSADFNGDGLADGQDFNLWSRHRTSALADTAAVPEPGTFALLAAGLLFVPRRRRAG